jgi:peroxiredoxin Q/BCP
MLNRPSPDFKLPATGNRIFRLSACIAKLLVIYFFPKDNTPDCTAEGEQFRDLYRKFSVLGCEIYGVSRDRLKSHESFKAQMKFPFELLCDAEEKTCKLFQVIKLKNTYGRHVRGIERSTFVFDRKGVLRWNGAGSKCQAMRRMFSIMCKPSNNPEKMPS